jgi:hypothetical protein
MLACHWRVLGKGVGLAAPEAKQRCSVGVQFSQCAHSHLKTDAEQSHQARKHL